MQYLYHWAFSDLIGSGGVAVFLSLSSAVPKKSPRVLLGRLHLAVLGQKDACHNVLGWASREENYLYNKHWEDSGRSGVEFRSGNSLLLDAHLQLI